MKWEYKIQRPTTDTVAAFIETANDAGQEGWQLIESWEMVENLERDLTKPARHAFYRALVLGRPIPAAV